MTGVASRRGNKSPMASVARMVHLGTGVILDTRHRASVMPRRCAPRPPVETPNALTPSSDAATDKEGCCNTEGRGQGRCKYRLAPRLCWGGVRGRIVGRWAGNEECYQCKPTGRLFPRHITSGGNILARRDKGAPSAPNQFKTIRRGRPKALDWASAAGPGRLLQLRRERRQCNSNSHATSISPGR